MSLSAACIAADLVSLVAQATEQGLLDPAALSALAIGPDAHHQTLQVWSMGEWDRYPMFESRAPLATISLQPWADAIERPDQVAPAKAELNRIMREALKLAAPQLAHPPTLVALFLVHERGCTVVAYAHAQGGAPLIGLMEKRAGSKLLYPDATFHEAGMTVFFPGGEVEGTSFESAEPAVLELRFDEMKLAKKNHDGVALRHGDELDDRVFSAGHVDQGTWPSDADAMAFVHAHFDTHPELWFDAGSFPDPSDTAGVDTWMARYLEGDTARPDEIVNTVAEAHGVAGARAFLKRLPSYVDGRVRAQARLAHLLAKTGRWDDAWSVVEPILGTSDEGWLYSLGPRVLLQRSQFEAALSQATAWAAASPRKVPRASVAQCAALVALGRDNEAETLARTVVQDHPRSSESYYALAIVLQSADPEAAAASFSRARSLGDSPRGYAEVDFTLPAILAWQARLDAMDAQRDALESDVVAAAEPILLTPVSTLEVDGSAVWQVAHRSDQGDGFRMTDAHRLSGTLGLLGAAKKGLARIDFEAETVEFLEVEEGGFVKSVTAAEGYAYALDHTVIRAARLSDLSWQSSFPTPTQSNYDELHTDGEVLVCSSMHNVAYVFAVTEPGELELRSSFSAGLMRAVCVAREHAYVATSDQLAVFDLTDPSEPRVVWSRALQDAEPHEDAFRPFRMRVVGRWLLVTPGDRSRGTWLLDVEVPARPVSMGVLPHYLMSVDVDGTLIRATDETGQIVMIQGMNGQIIEVTRFSGERVPFEHGTTAWVDGRIHCFHERETWVRLERGPQEPWAMFALIDEAEDAVVTWATDQLAKAEITAPVGALRISQGWTWLTLEVHGICRWMGVGSEEALHTFEAQMPELVPGFPDNPEPPAELSHEDQQRLQRQADTRWMKVFSRVARRLESALEPVAAGTVFVVGQAGDYESGPVGTLRYDRPWVLPPLPPTALSYPSPRALLDGTGWRHIDALTTRVRSRSDDRRDVLEVAAEGNPYALRIAASLGLNDPEVLAAFLTAGRLESVPSIVYQQLRPHVEREGVADVLERGFDAEDAATVLFAAKSLGRLDHEKPLNAALALMKSHPDLAVSAFEQMPPDRVRPHIETLRSVDWPESMVARVSNVLFDLGEREPLPALYRKAASDKSLEDDSWGLFEVLGEPGPAASWVERRFTAEALVGRVAEQQGRDAHTEPFWPEGVEPEETPRGWDKLMAAVFEGLEEEGLVPWFVEQLGGSWDSPDRALVLPAAERCLQNAASYRADAFALLDAVLATEEGVFTERERGRAQKLRQWTGVHRAWELYHSGDVDGARAEVDAQLLLLPNDADALFIDARLVWVVNSADACLARLDLTLPRLGTHRSVSDPGRAKLLNLYGCALDHLERVEDALVWFENAHRVHPDNGMYSANLAEAHEKLGHADQAVDWACKAKAQGYSNDVVSRLAPEG